MLANVLFWFSMITLLKLETLTTLKQNTNYLRKFDTLFYMIQYHCLNLQEQKVSFEVK